MVIREGADESGNIGRTVSCEERDMKDILDLDDDVEDEVSFRPVAAVSDINHRISFS